MKKNIVSLVGQTLIKFPFLNNLLLKYKQDSLRIVYYHMISSSNHKYYFDKKSINPLEFRNHLRYLKNKFDIISLENATELLKQNKSLKKKLVITFDDGFSEIYNVIAPILNDENITASFFLTTNMIDNKDLMWRNKLLLIENKNRNIARSVNYIVDKFGIEKPNFKETLLNWSFRTWPMSKKDLFANKMWKISELPPLNDYLIDNKPYLTSIQIKELISSGFDIGSHSMSHPIFSKLSYDEFCFEVLKSISFLEEKFNYKIKSFSYPFGEQVSHNFQDRLLNKHLSSDFVFLGIKNNLTNNSLNNLQRDNLEFCFDEMHFRFSILPILRNFIK